MLSVVSSSDEDEEQGGSDRENESVENSDETASDSESEAEGDVNERPVRPMCQGFEGMNGMRATLRDNGELKVLDRILIELTLSVRYNNTYEELIERIKLIKLTYVNVINVPTTKKSL